MEDMKIMAAACHKVMQHNQKEQHLLCGLRKMYEDNKKVRIEQKIVNLYGC